MSFQQSCRQALPPQRSIEHEVILKPGAKPSNRLPFRAVVFTILDLARGYHQMRMAPTSKQYRVFRTNQEIYHWNAAPMGLAGMPGTWTRLMRKALSHLVFVVVYLDDICIFSHSMADHVEHLRQRSVDFLGHMISLDGLHVHARKARAIAKWMEPSNIKELQRFLGLAGYYRRFIHRFAALVLPLSALVKKDVQWVWDETQRQAFNAIKLVLQHAPVLWLPDFNRPFIVTSDASHACISGVLSQLHDGSDLPVAFSSKKLGPRELNFPVHEKTRTDICRAACRRSRTTEKLQSITTRDKDVMLAVKQPTSELHEVGTAQLRMRVLAVSTAGSTVMSSLQLDNQTKRAFQKAYGEDPVFKHVLRRLCVPNSRKLRIEVIHNTHGAAVMAHPGIRRTQLVAAQWYFWPNMDLDITAYVQSCESCMRYNCGGQVVEPSSLHPDTHHGDCRKYRQAVFQQRHPVLWNPIDNHLEPGPKFTSKFWTTLVSLMKIKAAMATAHRAQAEGQTECQNRTLEDSLRCSIWYHENDWNEHLPMTEYAHATLVSSSSKLSPFFVDTISKPKNQLDTGSGAATVTQSRVEYASRFEQHRQEVIELARKNFLDAQAAQKRFYDKPRAENLFKVGDLALLSTQDLNISYATAETTLRSRKFILRFIGHYCILEFQNNVTLLDLPANLKHLSPRFNIDKLKVYTSNPDRFEGRVIPKSTPVVFADGGEPPHVVEALIKRRTSTVSPSTWSSGKDFLTMKTHGSESATSSTSVTGRRCSKIFANALKRHKPDGMSSQEIS
ncbi:hypothetical protein L917_12120, partial [Phytophthora nicotianae]